MRVKVTTKGEKQLLRRLREAARNAEKVMMEAVNNVAEKVLKDSKENYVPYESGALHDSGAIFRRYYWGRLVRVEIGYGGVSRGTNQYAIAVHENPSEADPPSWRGARSGSIIWSKIGTGAKYLERPLMEESHVFRRDLADEIKLRYLFDATIR
jgi:hypothetical protein